MYVWIQPQSLPFTFFPVACLLQLPLTDQTIEHLRCRESSIRGGWGQRWTKCRWVIERWDADEIACSLPSALSELFTPMSYCSPPINNTSLKLCQTDMLQPFDTHPAVSEWKRGKRKHFDDCQSTFCFLLVWWILRHPQHNIELRKGLCAVCGNPIPLPGSFTFCPASFSCLSYTVIFPPMGWKC